MDEKNAIRSESVLNQITVKIYTDGSKLHGRVGAGFYAENPSNSPKQAFFHLGIHGTVFLADVLAFPEVAKNLLLEKMHNQSIVVLMDSQAAIKPIIKCTVIFITVLNCILGITVLNSWDLQPSRLFSNKSMLYTAHKFMQSSFRRNTCAKSVLQCKKICQHVFIFINMIQN